MSYSYEKRNIRNHFATKLEQLKTSEKYDPKDVELIYESRDKIMSLIPEHRCNEYHELILTGTRTSVVNALRVSCSNYVPVRRLNIAIEDILTDDNFTERYQVVMHLNTIPVKRNIPINAKFRVKSKSIIESPGDGFGNFIMSEHIESTTPGVNASDYIAPGYRVYRVSTGKFVAFNNIHVVEKCGIDGDGKFANTDNIIYHELDYISLEFLKENGSFDHKIAKTSDVIDDIKNSGGDTDLSEVKLYNRRVIYVQSELAIKNAQYAFMLKYRDHIIRLDKAKEPREPKFYQVTEYDAHNYIIKAVSYGNNEDLFSRGCDCLIKKLREIDAGGQTTNIGKFGKETRITIMGADYVIGHLLREVILHIHPGVAFVAIETVHDLNNVVIVRIVDPRAIDIFHDGIKKLIEEYEEIKKICNSTPEK